jgi:membrane protein implicated in regulation of membrane protease activity
MNIFLFGPIFIGFGIWLVLVCRLSRKLKGLKQESLVGEWTRVEALISPLSFVVSVRGERRVATSQTPLAPGESVRITAAGSPLWIEPWSF